MPLTKANKTSFKKGNKPWNKGKKGLQTAWNKGIPRSEETKNKLREANLGRPSLKWKNGSGRKMVNLRLGIKIRESHYNWMMANQYYG